MPQSTTALAHLPATVLYFDISEQCGYSMVQQMALFEIIRTLFANTPLLTMVNNDRRHAGMSRPRAGGSSTRHTRKQARRHLR